MRLVTGPAGCGKTAYVVDRLSHALKTGNQAVRLLVPTATLAHHLQNRMVREGFVLRRGLIQTLAGFVADWADDAALASAPVLYLVVEEAARRVNRPEFARVAHLPGFCASLARTIEEFSSAGCDSARLEKAKVDAPLADAFLAVYREVDRELERRGLVLRAKYLERAARRIAVEGLRGIQTVWLDGFHALPDPELDVVAALARHADLTLTLARTDLTDEIRDRLAAMGFEEERLARARPSPALALVAAPGIEREAEEIARRILEQAAAGRPFREMGIVVRTAETYVPVLKSALERFGIPARFYFDQPLEEHAAVQFLAGAVDAMAGGWDHATTLAVLRRAPRFANSDGMDRFDFAVRQQVPNAGLGGLKELALEAGAEKLVLLLDHMAALEEWLSFALAPKDWAARFRTLRNLFRPNVAQAPEPHTHEAALAWRSQAAALHYFDQAVGEAATALDPVREIPLEPFCRAVKSALRLTPLRLDDGRRNVVHVLERSGGARVGATDRVRLRDGGEAVPPVSPAGRLLPRCGALQAGRPGESGCARRPSSSAKSAPCSTPPSRGPPCWQRFRIRSSMRGGGAQLAIDFSGGSAAAGAGVAGSAAAAEAPVTAGAARAARVVRVNRAAHAGRVARAACVTRVTRVTRVALAARAVRVNRAILATFAAHATFAPGAHRGSGSSQGAGRKNRSPTALEMYLQCGDQYFSQRTLRLEAAPPRPADRLDFLAQGNIVHEVLARWYAEPRDIAALFESVFERYAEEKRIPTAYHTERLRNAMLDDLRAFATNTEWPRAGFQSRTEEKFGFTLAEGLEVYGRIDRLDVAPDGRAYVVDYKYMQRAEHQAQAEQRAVAASAALPDGRGARAGNDTGRHVLRGAERRRGLRGVERRTDARERAVSRELV